MIVIDVGNTNIVVGLFYNKKIDKVIRFNTKDENLLKNLKKLNILNNKLDYKICIISSVSDYPKKQISTFIKYLNIKSLSINLYNISNRIKFNYISEQLGADRIANSFAAIKKYGKNSLVIDFGTATTFDLIINNEYIGGIISPGINTSHNALINSAFKLRKISITKIKKVIANNTKESMQSGFYWGYVSLINGLITKIMNENKVNPIIVLTGGLAKKFESEIDFETYYEPNLTLDGLYLIGQEKYEK